MLDWQHTAKPFTLVDVREDHEWSAEHIDNAFHLSKGIIERDIEKHFPDRNSCLVLYCGGGYRSALAAYNLIEWDTKIFIRCKVVFEAGKRKVSVSTD